jgi:hypothetical protein
MQNNKCSLIKELIMLILFVRYVDSLLHNTGQLDKGSQPIVDVYFTALYRALASSRTRLLDHTKRRVTVGRTPLNE